MKSEPTITSPFSPITKVVALLFISIVICGCTTRYSITVLNDNEPVSFANYRWHLDKWGRTGLEGEGQTDINGCALVESYPGAYLFVLKDDIWGEVKLRKEAKSYIVNTVSTNERPMHIFAQIVLGISEDKNKTSNQRVDLTR